MRNKEQQILKKFITETFNMGSFFSLGRHVTMNALGDTISGPHPVDTMLEDEEPSMYLTSLVEDEGEEYVMFDEENIN